MIYLLIEKDIKLIQRILNKMRGKNNMSDKIIENLDNDNLPEEYKYMAMYIIDNLVHENIYDSNKHAIILIEENGFIIIIKTMTRYGEY